MVIGFIYTVTNLVNGRVYVGQTRRTVGHRWSVHKSEAKRRPRCYFHKAIAKHGGASFRVETMASAESVEELNALETAWIDRLQSANPLKGYNLTFGGDNAVRTEQARLNGSLAQRGKHASLETRQKMSTVRRGRKQTPQHVAARTAPLKGRKPSLAARLAVAESNRRRALAKRKAAEGAHAFDE